ncbi:MAG TPA: LCP family protein [Thermomicrobiales bacterium]|nr:LCP family protein [Thermomicrobiales bacterium]
MNPAVPEQPAPSTTPSRFWFLQNRRRKVAGGLLVLLAIAAVVLAIQSWRVLSAIVDAEHAAVVPLPPSDIALATATTVPTSMPPTESAQIAAATTGTSPTTVPPTPTPAPSASPEPSADKPDPPSQLDVARQLVDAGIGGGDPGSSDIWEGKTELNILVLGVDKRADGGDQNADVIIIAHLDLVNHRLSGVSLPRDLEVEIPGVGPDKINGAYNYGVLATPDDPVAGVAKVRDTIESLFGIPIDGYVLVDFSGFSDVVDAMGGITVDVPYEIVDDEYPTEDYGVTSIHFDPGVQEMDGDQALIYVRTRHADSDDARRQRQLDVIRAIFGQGKSITSIANADEIILSAGGAIQTSFDLEEQLTLARIAYEMSDSDIQLTTLGEPLLQAAWSEEGRWIYTGDPEAIKAFVLDAISTGGDGAATPGSGS